MKPENNYDYRPILYGEALTPLYFQWANDWRLGEIATHAGSTPLHFGSIDVNEPAFQKGIQKYLKQFAAGMNWRNSSVRFLDAAEKTDGPFFLRNSREISVNIGAIRRSISQQRAIRILEETYKVGGGSPSTKNASQSPYAQRLA